MRRQFKVAGWLLLAVMLSSLIDGSPTATASPFPLDGCWDPNPCPVILYEVDMLSATDGWAVGAGGLILRWNGLRWRPQPSPTTIDLGTVAMVSPTDGWAGGPYGTLLHWDGHQWTPHPIATDPSIFSIDMRTASDGWLAALTGIWQWDGSAWTKRHDFGAYAISARTATDVWSAGTPVVRWNGSQWEEHDHGAGSPNLAIKMFATNDGWIGGVSCFTTSCERRDLILQRWNGLTWTPMLPTREGVIIDIDGVAGTDVWAVGEHYGTDSGAVIYHWNGSTLTHSDTTIALSSISMVSPTDGWAVGNDGQILHWNGATWASYVPTVTRIYTPLVGR